MQKQLKKNLRRALLALCLLVILYSGGRLLQNRFMARREAEKNRLLQLELQQARQETADAPPTEEELEEPVSGGLTRVYILPQYKDLWVKNKDMWGWLTIPDTPIDYPVMYTPRSPEFYRRRSFDKNYAYSGSLFIGEGCVPTGNHVIVYGHNMDNGTMFSTLTYYWDKAYADAHPIIHFDTILQEGVFQVVSAFYSQVYDPDKEGAEDIFRYYLYPDLERNEVFWEYIRKAKENSLYDTNVDVRYGRRILTLSTCSYHITDGRFIVIAMELTPEEAAKFETPES